MRTPARIERGAVMPRLDSLMQLLGAAGFTVEVAPAIGEGVDRTLIRAALERSPEERIRAATVGAQNLQAYLEVTRDRPGRLPT